jgi:hypothetical protein
MRTNLRPLTRTTSCLKFGDDDLHCGKRKRKLSKLLYLSKQECSRPGEMFRKKKKQKQQNQKNQKSNKCSKSNRCVCTFL